MNENLYCLERLSVQKHLEYEAEVRRYRIAKEAVHASRPGARTFQHRVLLLIPTAFRSTGKPRIATATHAARAHDSFTRVGKSGWPDTVQAYEYGADEYHVLEQLAQVVTAVRA